MQELVASESAAVSGSFKNDSDLRLFKQSSPSALYAHNSEYLLQPGILPGYHMNKEHWLTILLDGTAEDGLIRELFEISYSLTKEKKKRRT